MEISRLKDDQLWDRTKAIAGCERATLADLIEHLAELDRRRLHRTRGFRSLFEYCVHFLRCSRRRLTAAFARLGPFACSLPSRACFARAV